MNRKDIDILVVDDDDDDAALTLRALDELALGRRAHRARDGEEALDLLFGAESPSCAPKLILLDMRMPRVDGLEVLAALRKDPRTKAVPVVILTSSNRAEDVARCYELGANSYIVKPAGFEEYSAAVVGAGSYWLTWNRSVETPLIREA
ncbi:MAG: response regulator [Elusimicrobiota bacterium]